MDLPTDERVRGSLLGLHEIAEHSAKCAESLAKLGPAMKAVASATKRMARRYLADKYGRLPFRDALRGIASESRHTRGKPWRPIVIGRWIRMQYDLLRSA